MREIPSAEADDYLLRDFPGAFYCRNFMAACR